MYGTSRQRPVQAVTDQCLLEPKLVEENPASFAIEKWARSGQRPEGTSQSPAN